MPLTAAEILGHPAYPNVIWDLKPTAKGKCKVAANRGGPLDIAYEIHGRGLIKIIKSPLVNKKENLLTTAEKWIAGHGALKWYFQRQTQDFGHEMGDKYSCLIFDNRGIGESDKPLMRYSTSEMARDTLELLDHVGWKGRREVHVVGVSMGGMIAQEIACIEPERIASLSLVSTAAQLKNSIGYFENLRNRINIFLPKSPDTQITELKTRASASWVTAPDEIDGAFPTNGDRFAAQELAKRADTNGFTRKGFICQAIAIGWHLKTPAQLQEMAEKVGRERIQVVHGTEDPLLTFRPHAEELVEGLGEGVERVVFEGRGHYLPFEVRQEFRRLVEGIVERTGRMR
ncbi:hypothetical protein ACLMJK_001993 [Lecanora helva]